MEVVKGKEPKDADQELVEDLIPVAASLTGKGGSNDLLLNDICMFRLESGEEQTATLDKLPERKADSASWPPGTRLPSPPCAVLYRWRRKPSTWISDPGKIGWS